jgi:Xaa-Pro aminopeptidase
MANGADGAARAFLWKNGAMSDLNTSIPTGSGLGPDDGVGH